MLTDLQLLAETRRLAGNPIRDKVSDRTFRAHLTNALEVLSDRLGYEITDATIALVAGTAEYDLPADFNQLISLAWNDTELEPASVQGWVRDGQQWRNVAANPVLSEYALLGRKLLLNPPPSAAAVSTDHVLTYRYIAAGDTLSSTTPYTAGLSDADQKIACYLAAIEWLMVNPDESGVNASMANGLQLTANQRLAAAIKRHVRPNRAYHPSVRVAVNRRGAAR